MALAVALAPKAAIAGQLMDAAMDHLLVDEEAKCPDGHQADNGDNWSFPCWLTILGFLILTFNSAMAILRSQGEMVDIAFVVFSYVVLVALFVCLRMYECAIAGSTKREWLKIAVWVLTTLLTLAFSYKVAAVMPAPVAIAVWLMGFATIAGGFIAFFICKEKK